jgi:hypothetical protein
MALRRIQDKYIVLPNYDYSEKYWPIISKTVFDKIEEDEINTPILVEEILKDCFEILCSILNDKISEQKKASFYIFCHYIHEESIQIWQKQNEGLQLGEIEEDFAASRRILKIILEQSCKLDLVGSPNFCTEAISNIKSFTKGLEELIYIGTWCYNLSEYISRSQLFPNSIGVKIENGELNILTYQPYPKLFEFIYIEKQKHDSDIVLSDSMLGFKELLETEFKVDYNVLASFIIKQKGNAKYRFSLFRIDNIIQELHDEYSYNEEFSKTFFAGLTVNKSNSLSIQDCILKNQHENRYIFRPILELNIDGKFYHMVGYYKWIESFILLSTNSFPFGCYPSEWKKYKEIEAFIKETDDTHDKLLEEPIIKLLEEDNRVMDSNVVSIKQIKRNSINIEKTIGDIDILFLNEKNKIIYVCECKHNRSRFDLNNWKRDYTNFKSKYEAQLDRKVNWVQANKLLIENHLKIKYPDRDSYDLNDYQTKGIFIINAPTVYMFDGKYRAFTISDIKDLLSEKYFDIKFEFTFESTGRKLMIEHPYFKNLNQKLNE